MPCYQIQLMTVEFNVNRIDLLEKALRGLNYSFIKSEVANIIRLDSGIEINLDEKVVIATSSEMGTVNRVKRKYAEVALTEVAQKKKWIMKRDLRNSNKFELRRY